LIAILDAENPEVRRMTCSFAFQSLKTGVEDENAAW
jgi:hypothetical protein